MPRVDYLKVRFKVPRGEIDGPFWLRMQIHDQRAQDLVDAGVSGGRHLTKDYSSSEVFTVYYLDMWGEVADRYADANITVLKGDEIMRIDYRCVLDGNVNLKELGDKSENKGRRQYQWFNKPLRSKKGDRDAGGYGFAKGSHKSEKRISVYKRGQELPAAEIQFRGDKAAFLWNDMQSLKLHEQKHRADTGEVFGDRAIDVIGRIALDLDLSKECGINLSELELVAMNEPYDEEETRLATLDALWSELDAETQQDWLQQVLFGPNEIRGTKVK